MARRRVVSPEPIRPRDDERRERRRQERMRKKAEDLHEQGMPFQMALAVSQGRLDLNEALERMARNERIEKLMVKHDLSRALATQIALGQADMEHVLHRRRLDEHRTTNRQRSVLEDAANSGQQIVLGLHGARELVGTVVSNDAYSVSLRPASGGEAEEIHKLQIQYAYPPPAKGRVDTNRRVDEQRAANPGEPIIHPQDRYPCSDKRLFRHVDSKAPVKVTLLEGDVFSGVVAWFSRYEFQVNDLKGASLVTIFRHALADLKDAK